MPTLRTARGRSLPLGATALAEGINFALLCRHGTGVHLVLYALETDDCLGEIELHPRRHRTGDHWHILVAGLPQAFRYGWRVDGPHGRGNRFNPATVLLDPATTSLAGGSIWGQRNDQVTRGQGDKVTGGHGDKVTTVESPTRLPDKPLSTTNLTKTSGHPFVVSPGHPVTVSPGHPVTPSPPPSIIPAPPLSVTRSPYAIPRSVFFRRAFNWREDSPPLIALEDTILYELHVRGFTCHSSAEVVHPGTFAGLVEKAAYLKQLGITAVELLPVHEFDENDCPFFNPRTGERLRNFWGYNSIAFAAPKAAYASTGKDYGQVTEFREMVRLLHEKGLEVVLDVVFNHTGEGDDRGRTYSFRGLDNELYYMLGPDGRYLNFSGCGNTVNCNHPVVRDLLMTCLRFWVAEMHVDGLRFDLASVFGRDRHGNVLLEPPIVESIGEDGVLRDTKLIAEPWDAGGLYQVGRFPFGARWSEWNGRYRDDVRRFWRGDAGLAGALATRLCGSADLYEAAGRLPQHSINFITCHDGFTLADLVAYNHKHNEANGEGNRDGSDDNYSWNCGAEGPTDNPAILALRRRQVRNFVATLLLSQGVPMLLAGDEFLRSQGGNNNAWCQDNDISWIDWARATTQADFLRFVREMIAFRKKHPALRRREFFRGQGRSANLEPDITWHGVEPFAPDFSGTSRSLAFLLNGSLTGREPDRDIYVACNAWVDTLPFRIPGTPSGHGWRRAVDTALASPLDIAPEEEGPQVTAGTHYPVAPFSVVVLVTVG